MTQAARIVPTIAIVDRRSQQIEPAATAVAQAVQMQVTRDFAPIWGTDASIKVFQNASDAPEGAWLVLLADSADGDLGYHTWDTTGTPYAVVDGSLNNPSWPITVSHEVLEMLADPGNPFRCLNGYLLEVGDPVENYAYPSDPSNPNSLQVSDFVYPAWFGEGAGTRFDQMQACTAAFQVLPYGYSTSCGTNGLVRVNLSREGGVPWHLRRPLSQVDRFLLPSEFWTRVEEASAERAAQGIRCRPQITVRPVPK